MKTKLLTVALLTCTYFYSNAQVEKGSALIGGSVSFTNVKNDTTGKTSGSSAFLKVGRAFSDNVVWGVFGIFGSGTNKSFSNPTATKIHTYGGGIFNRLYKPLGKGFNLYGETGLAYAHTSGSGFIGRQPAVDQVALGFAPGISYKVFDWAHLELSLPNLVSANYQKARTEVAGVQSNTSNFGVSTSLKGSTADLLGLGFTVLF
ncbi:hypothetical protein [Niabella sp.]|uniref:hypothetical protein n=1 Tax=Niabella sp. TaxID=1962976 RepID=UPI00261F806C|nr:hypothetical protein [Niabella sp.]